MLLAVFLLAFLAMQTCASHGDEISYEEAEAIARDQIDFEPEKDRPRERGDRGDGDRTVLALPV